MNFDPAISVEIAKDEKGQSIVLACRAARIDRSLQINADMEAWNGERLHQDSFRPGKDAERKRFIKVLAKDHKLDAKAIEKAVLDLTEEIRNRLARKDEGSKQQQEIAPPTIEMLDAPPPGLRRPLAFVEGRAYVAIWPHIRIAVTEDLDDEGNLIKYDKPRITTERRLWVVREDGEIFGEGQKQELDDLGFELSLKLPCRDERAWSTAGIKAYQKGERPDPVDVFHRVSDVVDRFIDFDHSLAPQKTMSEMVACWILSTWFLERFDVAGFIWPNGESGSGKTQLLTVISELSYLGNLILAGGSYATLRDEAMYGATLCFDEAESIADPNKFDPDKRALLLAGNRRGASIPIKVEMPGGGWETQYISGFCARAFSAIRLPDSVLGNRSIIVPLIRSLDRNRNNANPVNHSIWPHDRNKLVDDLWALALSKMSELRAWEIRVLREARLTGRNLEPWLALLSVAGWLSYEGEAGLYTRMEQLSVDYQSERSEFEDANLNTIIIRAIAELAGCELCELCELSQKETEWFFQTAEITERVKRLIELEDLAINTERLNSHRVGKVLQRTRFKNRRTAGSGKKGWVITGIELARWLKTYNLQPDQLAETKFTKFTKFTPDPKTLFDSTNYPVSQSTDQSSQGSDIPEYEASQREEEASGDYQGD